MYNNCVDVYSWNYANLQTNEHVFKFLDNII